MRCKIYIWRMIASSASARRRRIFQPERIIDAHGHWIWPGIFDLCAQVNADRLASEGRAASAAGITDLCVPPDIHPCLDNPAAVDLVRLASETQAQVNIHIVGGLTQTLAGGVLAELATLRQAGCVAVSNGRRSVVDSQVLRRAMEYAASHDLTVLLHAEDSWLRGHGCAHEGVTATRLGLPAIPAAAEVIGLYRDLALVELTGVRAHFCRLTTAESVRLIAQAKARGLPVSADVAMHQLHLCDQDLADFDTNCHVDPPLRHRPTAMRCARGWPMASSMPSAAIIAAGRRCQACALPAQQARHLGAGDPGAAAAAAGRCGLFDACHGHRQPHAAPGHSAGLAAQHPEPRRPGQSVRDRPTGILAARARDAVWQRPEHTLPESRAARTSGIDPARRSHRAELIPPDSA